MDGNLLFKGWRRGLVVFFCAFVPVNFCCNGVTLLRPGLGLSGITKLSFAEDFIPFCRVDIAVTTDWSDGSKTIFGLCS